MATSRFSIRQQLLILGALATASIWAGALLEYLQLRRQAQELHAVRGDLAAVARFGHAARAAAEERGLSNGWLLSPVARGGDGAELREVRARLDSRLTALVAACPSLAGAADAGPLAEASADPGSTDASADPGASADATSGRTMRALPAPVGRRIAELGVCAAEPGSS